MTGQIIRILRTNSARVRHRGTLIPALEEIILQHPTSYWVEHLHEIDVPAAPVNSMSDVFAMDQTEAREMRIDMNHPETIEPVSLVGSPLKLSDTPVSYREPPPMLGQHTDDVLTDILGLNTQEIEALKQKGIV